MNTIEKAGNRTIIKLATPPTDPAAFDGYEIAQVVEDKDGECSPIDDPGTLMTDDGRKTFWSVYGHIPNAGVDCIADRDTYEQCLDLLRQMGVISQEQIEAGSLGRDFPVSWEELADTLREARDVLNRLVTSSKLGVDPITEARRIVNTIDSYDL